MGSFSKFRSWFSDPRSLNDRDWALPTGPTEWHPWFAWFPVRVTRDTCFNLLQTIGTPQIKEIAWLKRVDRRWSSGRWEYRKEPITLVEYNVRYRRV